MNKEEQKSEKELEQERERLYQEKIEELKKRDPFVYNNF